MTAGDDELPEGWEATKLGEGLVLDIQPGFACGAHNRTGTGIPHLRPMNVNQDGRIDLGILKFVSAEEVNRNARWIRQGDVLFNNTNSPELVGKTAYYDQPEPRAFSNHMTRIRCQTDVLDPRYCALVLHQLWREEHFEGVCNNHVSQASVSRPVLENTPIPLPPLTEQKRIVAKVEEVLNRASAARARLAKVPAILTRFRQAVLAAANSGQLTTGWRESNEENSHCILDKHVTSDLEMLDGEELPASWSLADVQGVCSVIVDCPHSTPKWTTEGEICLRTTNFKLAKLDLSELRYVAKQTYRERIARLEPREGDVVYSREGGILGIACIMPPGVRACLGQRMMLMRVGDRILPRLLMHFLNCPATLRTVESLTGGTASPHLNVGDIKRFAVPVPPLSEQHEIVRRVDILFKQAGAIEKRVSAASHRVDKLTQTMLAKAFRGELVPTEAELARAEGRDYEPASALLERIRAERNGGSVAPKPGRPRFTSRKHSPE